MRQKIVNRMEVSSAQRYSTTIYAQRHLIISASALNMVQALEKSH
jgi:hypothetical protein